MKIKKEITGLHCQRHKPLHREEPDIEIELVATDRDANLLQRSWVNYKNAT